MRRVMIIGQPGSGKSTLARTLGGITHLPVVHIDHIHWKPGWVERPGPEKDALCAEVHARETWIFEGGRSVTWPERLARADSVIWLDLPLAKRLWRVLWRTVRYWGRTRPDLPEGCPEKLSWTFLRWIWDTRHTSRDAMQALYRSVPADKSKFHLRGNRDVEQFLSGLRIAASTGNLGISHR
ncbi:MAG: AAA family ATPase [Alphaproteobacteria bacterium]|nr:AAA family ATPase [Alphaproteobacteria bacterium]